MIQYSKRFLFSEDYEVLEQISLERNIKPKTKETYYQTISHFTKLLNTSFKSLLELYQKEEESVVWKKSTLKKHLIYYRNYLYNNFDKSSAKIYFSKLLTVFRHLEVELGSLPNFNSKISDSLPPISFKDLPTSTELVEAYNIANPLMKAVILFQTSSGCARRETLNLTINDYLKANNVKIKDRTVVESLSSVNVDYTPCFSIKRQKTGKFYFTYCSPQANKQIMEYLLTREDLDYNSPLFDCNLYYWNKYFNEINDSLDMGTARHYNRFRSHMLRKYHASTLYNNGMSMDDIDNLQGRSKDSTHQSYFMDDPDLLKKKYMEHIDCLKLEV